MRRVIYTLLAFIILGTLAWVSSFYWQNLRGVWTAVKRPTSDIRVLMRNKQDIFTLPQGYTISIFSDNLRSPRDLVFDPNGVLFVSDLTDGVVVALPDADNNGVAEKKIVLQNLEAPHGLAFRCSSSDNCELYVAERNLLTRYDYNPETLMATNKKKLIDLPNAGLHITRSLWFIKENNRDILLISIGSTCNVCYEEDVLRATVQAYDIASGKLELYSRGLRNAVFFTEHPRTGQVWVTEMGRDLLGDDLPPDEINILERGKNYGWPVCYGKNVHDTDFDDKVYIRNPCMEPFETASLVDLPAHVAPLGLAFIPEHESWPVAWHNDLLVALHGSWNRSEPVGYKVVRVMFNADGVYEVVEDFITGWLKGGEKLGRPVDILVRPEGGLFISDDGAGVVYLMKPQEKQELSTTTTSQNQ